MLNKADTVPEIGCRTVESEQAVSSRVNMQHRMQCFFMVFFIFNAKIRIIFNNRSRPSIFIYAY